MIFSIPHKNFYGKDSYAYWENFLSDDDINLLLAQPEWLEQAQAHVGTSDNFSVNETVRSSQISWVGVKPQLRTIWEKISITVAEVNRRYFHFNLTGFYEPMQFSTYIAENQGHYSWHTDSDVCDSKVPRKLSMSILLSDPSEFEGGELQVKATSDEPVTLECIRGRAWFFPSYTLHRVAPVTKGIRRSLVLWVGGPQFY